MMQFGLVGIGAGAAAALLFASVTSGSLLSIVLFYLAPLPIMIAGLGWSHWAALLAALVGSLAVVAIFGGVFFFAFVAGIGAPAWWLCYLSSLARPVPAAADGGQAALEWYPPGRLVLWAALLGALVVIVAIPNFGFDADSFRTGLAAALSQHDAGRSRRGRCLAHHAAHRFPRHRGAAGRGRDRHRHQPRQSLARRPRS